MCRSPVAIAVVAIVALTLSASLDGQSRSWLDNPRHDKGNRWEGLLGADHSSPSWEIRSFVGGIERYPMDASVDLSVWYYVPDETAAFVEAREVKPLLHYLMRPKPGFLPKTAGWRRFDGWSTGALLLPNMLSSDKLGILVRLGGTSAAINRLAPAIVRHTGPAVSLRSYSLDVFTMRGVGTFSFDVIDAKGVTRSYRNQPGVGDRGALRLAFDVPPVEGRTRIVLTAPYVEQPSENLELECVFFNKSP